MAESQFAVAPLGRPGRMRAQRPSSGSSKIVPARESVTLSESPQSVKARTSVSSELIRGALVIQIWAKPALDGAQFQALAALIIEHLIAADPANGKVARLRMGEI